MKYGIKHNAGQIEAISRFANDIIPVGFIEITYLKYDEFLRALDSNPFATYDDKNNSLILDNQALVDFNANSAKQQVRNKLLILSNELDLQVRMSEDTTDTQAKFNALKAQYEGM